eukprot:scaffold29284_cov63-Phaeocystis_antarctica.AAC.3
MVGSTTEYQQAEHCGPLRPGTCTAMAFQANLPSEYRVLGAEIASRSSWSSASHQVEEFELCIIVLRHAFTCARRQSKKCKGGREGW